VNNAGNANASGDRGQKNNAANANNAAGENNAVGGNKAGNANTAANPAALQLKPEISSQHQRIQNLLPVQTKQKLARMVPAFEQQVRVRKQGTDLRALAAAEVRKEFPHLSSQQTDVLTFVLLHDAYDNSKDPLGDLSTMDQLQLQRAMEQKSQFESMFSNIMKSVSDTSDSIIQNIK
jgi:hypothetical protein